MTDLSYKPGQAIKLAERVTPFFTVRRMREVSLKASMSTVIHSLAKSLEYADNPVKAAFDLVYRSAVYVPEESFNQIIRWPQTTISQRRATCTDYSIFLSALLVRLNVPHRFRMVSFRRKDFQHIYVVTKSGIVLDACLGQKQDGTDTFNNRPSFGLYNKEVKYAARVDFNVL